MCALQNIEHAARKVTIAQATLISFLLQVPSYAELLETPFLDRGVRAVAAIGSKVHVARIGAIKEAIPGFVPLDELPPEQQPRLSFVWNTGRCGSTLMHKYV